MPRFFNTTGPCVAEWYQMLSPEGRIPDLLPLVDRRQYFVLHAARQTGKTTAVKAFAARLRARGDAAAFATVESSQGIDEIERAEPLWLEAIESRGQRDYPTAAAHIDEARERLVLSRTTHLDSLAQRLRWATRCGWRTSSTRGGPSTSWGG